MGKEYIYDSEVITKIREVIYKLYPVKEPRIDSDMYTYISNRTKMPKMGINFYFYKDDIGSTKTQILFMNDGTSISKCYLVDGKVSNNSIGSLISFLLQQFPYVSFVRSFAYGIEMNFTIGLEHYEQEGISCKSIDVEFNTHPKFYGDFRNLFRDYLEYIVNTFYESMSNTPEFKKAYENYSSMIKKQIVDSLSYEELLRFASLMEVKELRELLSSMDNDYFFKLCNSFQKSSDMTKRKVLELKVNAINGDVSTTFMDK